MGQTKNSLYPLFWQHGEKEEELREEIGKMQEGGIGGFIVESRPHPDYLSYGWWRDLDVILSEASKRQMEVWIFDDGAYPSGLGGGKVKELYPEGRIEVVDSLSATLGSGFLCMDALEMRREGKTLEETASQIRKRVGRIDIFFVVDDFKYLVQGGRVSPSVGKIGDILDIKVILTMKNGRIEPYKKCRGINAALRNIRQIAESGEKARLGAIYVGNQALFEQCRSQVDADCEASLNLIVSSHVGPNTTGIAIEWAAEKE